MTEAAQHIGRVTTPSRTFEGHAGLVFAVAVFPDRCRMVTGSGDKTLRLWDLEDGIVLKKMEGHHNIVRGVAVSRDGQLIASGDDSGEVIAWDRDGESLTQPIKVHSKQIWSLDFCPDNATLASGSWDATTELWDTKTWQVQGNPINCCASVLCVRHSPTGEHLAIATMKNIQIWNPGPGKRECIAKFEAHSVLNGAWNSSLAWTLDGTRLLSASTMRDHTIREWNTSTWKQVGESWKGHADYIYDIAMSPTGTFVASSSGDSHVRLWRLSDRRTIAIFKHPDSVFCVAFSMDGKHILSGGQDKKISKWAVPDNALLEDVLLEDTSKAQVTNTILTMHMTARNACIAGDWNTADRLLTQEINADSNDYNSYANRSCVMARKSDWDRALHDAIKSITIQPSLVGCISKGIALCGKRQFQDAMKAFDLAFMFVDGDLNKTHLLLLIKAIALFNENQHGEAILRVQELAVTCPNADTLACRIVEAYLHVQMGINALDGARHNDAANHFTAAVDTIGVSSTSDIHSKYDVFVVLFGWDLQSFWRTAHQNWCHALFRAGRLPEALKSYRYMMDRSDEATKESCLDWSTAFKQDYSALYAANGVADFAALGDDVLAAGNYDRAIELYSAAIDLDFATDTVFSNRSKARSEKMLWEDALHDAEQVIKINRSSYLGYQLKHAALHGAQRYDEAIEAFQVMFSKLGNAPDSQVQGLRCQFISPSVAKGAIQQIIHAQLDNAPHRLLNTFTGRLCDREALVNTFTTSAEYKELLSSTMTHANLRTERIQEVVMTYFRCVTLSHRWEGKEPLLQGIQDKTVYELNPVGGIMKLQSFCKTARAAGYRWGWIDTCCIDQTNNVELQKSLNSMFVWYRTSALTMVYLSDVPPSSKSGALARSAWNTRGWTVPEFLAPRVILFYQNDWTLYLDDRSHNHKESVTIMQELEDATGIDAQVLVAFRPGMIDAREKLQWASTRVTTVQEDIAYSLFGIFDVRLPVMYGEQKHNALGRLLQEIVAQSGDITALDWVGTSSEFNSCLPADINSYQAPPYTLPSLSEGEMQTLVSSLRDAGAVELALRLYHKLESLSPARFAHRRLRLPCITFHVTEVRQRRREDYETYFTYDVQADGLHDLQITTEDKLLQFSRARPTRQSFLLVRPWDRRLLELPDFADDMLNVNDLTPPESPVQDSPGGSSAGQGLVDSESRERALCLIVRLGQVFSAFLLARQRGGEYKRIASDRDITAQVKDVASGHDIMDVRTLEIL